MDKKESPYLQIYMGFLFFVIHIVFKSESDNYTKYNVVLNDIEC